MAVEDFEIDLEVLEDMCSELEEYAFLVDKDLNVIWVNKVLKEKLRLEPDYLKIQKNTPEYLKVLCMQLLGQEAMSLESSKKVFATGKLVKSLKHTKDRIIKTISIPIKLGNEVAYVLEIVEELSQIEPNTQRHQNTSPKEAVNIVKFFLDSFERPCLLIYNNGNQIISNSHFDKEFSGLDILKHLIFEQFNKSPKESLLKDLKQLVCFSHTMEKKVLKHKSQVIGYVFLFKRKNSSVKHSLKGIMKKNRIKH